MAFPVQDPVAFMKLAVIGVESTEASAASTHASHESNSEETQSDPDSIPAPTLRSNGEVWSEGSAQHPDNCTPCAFYCFKRWGCSKDKDCNFCHMNHVSKQRQRREEWKLRQREKRRNMRGQQRCTEQTNFAATAARCQSRTVPPRKQSLYQTKPMRSKIAHRFTWSPSHMWLRSLQKSLVLSPWAQTAACINVCGSKAKQHGVALPRSICDCLELCQDRCKL